VVWSWWNNFLASHFFSGKRKRIFGFDPEIFSLDGRFGEISGRPAKTFGGVSGFPDAAGRLSKNELTIPSCLFLMCVKRAG